MATVKGFMESLMNKFSPQTRLIAILLILLSVFFIITYFISTIIISYTAGMLSISMFQIIFLSAIITMILLPITVNYFFFDTMDKAELQLLGGATFANSKTLINNGSAAWPFVKLSASMESLRLQTPFGDFTWKKHNLRLPIRKTGPFPGRWEIRPEDPMLSGPVFFSTLPWNAEMVERKLKSLGYEVSN
jgi:hypothetical protein